MNRKSFRAKKPLRVGADQVRIRPDKSPEKTLAPLEANFSDTGPFDPEAVAMKYNYPTDAGRPTCVQAFKLGAETWLAAISAAGLAPSTVDCYRRDLRDFEQAVTFLFGHAAEIEDIGGVDQADVDAVVRHWLAAGASVVTVLRRFSAVRGLAAYLSRAMEIDCSAILSARLPQMSPNDRQPVDDETLNELASVEHGKDWIGARNHALLLLQADTGLSTSEIASLDCGNLLDNGAGIAVTNTVLAVRIVPLSPGPREALARYRCMAPFAWFFTRPLFINARGRRISVRSIQMAFSGRRIELGLPTSVCPMSLRHRLGENLAAKGNPPAIVAARLGVSVHSVERYYAERRERRTFPSNRKTRSRSVGSTTACNGKRRRVIRRTPTLSRTIGVASRRERTKREAQS
jgi:integrase/recombinase XerC